MRYACEDARVTIEGTANALTDEDLFEHCRHHLVVGLTADFIRRVVRLETAYI